MTKALHYAVAATLLAVTIDPAIAGSYLDVVDCKGGLESDPTVGCFPGVPAVQHPSCAPDCEITPNGITHPISYTGIQTSLPVRICVDATHPDLVPIVDAAIDKWEGLAPMIDNCRDCGTWEHGPAASGKPFAFTVVLHELGHCALALEHVDRVALDSTGTAYVPSSFTRSVKAARVVGAIDDGLDDIRGSADDYHAGILGPAESVSWFRSSDNDPFIVDSTVIDITTYTTARARLPAGDTWGASANMCVYSPSFCDSNPPPHRNESQAVMYSAIGE